MSNSAGQSISNEKRPHEKAATLSDAFNAFDSRQPIKPHEIDTIFVSRPRTQTDLMEAELNFTIRPVKWLFVGHRGSGKSSELVYLSTRMRHRFLPINVPLRQIFPNSPVSHTEVIFAILLRLLQEASDYDVILEGVMGISWVQFLEEQYAVLKHRFYGESNIRADNEGSIKLKVKALIFELETQLSTGDYRQVKDKFSGKEAELIQRIGDLGDRLRDGTRKQPLLLVEDLDKFDRKSSKELFVNYAGTLTSPRAHVIYTFPVWLRYSSDFPEIKKGFNRVYFLPNITLKQRTGEPDLVGIKAMQDIVAARAEMHLFQTDAVTQIIQLSGGNVQSLINITQQAILHAAVAKATAVQCAHVKRVADAERDNYLVLLRHEQIKLLREIRDHPTKDLGDVNEAKQELLYNGSLLEYGDADGPWADVNPVVSDLLDR